MARNSICQGCRFGDHSKHRRVIQGSPGIIGGVVCVCRGECEDKRYMPTYEQLMGFSRRREV